MPKIDPSARVSPKAELADDVEVGPFSVIDEHVRIGAGTRVGPHCVVTGHTELGERNHLVAFCSIGTPPQDHTYGGEPTRLLVGDGNQIREYVTINTGTVKGGGITIIGSHGLFMSCSHVAHDCIVGDRVVVANGTLLAGHVKLEDGVIMSGSAAVHHYVTIGRVAFIGGLTPIGHDVPPFMMMVTDHRAPRGVNVVGMQRNGYDPDEVRAVQRAFKLVYRNKLNAADASAELNEVDRNSRPVKDFLSFRTRMELGKLGRFLETTRQERGGLS